MALSSTADAGVDPGGCHTAQNQYYVANSPEDCARIRFYCPEGYSPFFNDCGCGCEGTPID